jgi:Glycosyl hydrolase 2 galactose-binding domain-like/Exo-beta-D-glucosaminidase Ig-fold domain/Glycosyl hydrolases family 2/NedA-like, galactose-binding domain
MSTSRRDFLKTTILAGAGAALPPVSARAATSVGAGMPSAAMAAEMSSAVSGGFTRGIGIYPGAPSEDFSPILEIDTTTYRNLALLRPAYHSSSYDYNLTAQLVTDGIKDAAMPSWVSVAISPVEPLPKEEREALLDHYAATVTELLGEEPSIQIEMAGGAVPEIDQVNVFLIMPPEVNATTMRVNVSASDDGYTWEEVGNASSPQEVPGTNYPPDLAKSAKLYNPAASFSKPIKKRYYKIDLSADLPEKMRGYFVSVWRAGQVAFYRSGERVQVGGPYTFNSAWMSAGSAEEWVCVDLGARCSFDRVTLYWVARAAEGSVQISDDAVNWKDLQSLNGRTAQVDDFQLTVPAQARYVRVLMTRPTGPNGYILSEIEVYGRGGPVAQPHAPALAQEDGRLNLAGGNWRLQRDNFVQDGGEALSKSGYADSSWVVGTVPGTVLTSYYNVGAIPDPNYGQNQLHISDSYFYADFWYRREFDTPKLDKDEKAWLNFDGINWKADVYLNGEKLGRIEGGFMRGRFDVTGKLLAGKTNALAVRIEKNATPGSCKQKTYQTTGRNGGALGADNPTYHASIGWDWIPTIRGRNTGIWGDVFLTVTGPVTVENPFVTTTLPLPDTSSADVSISVDLVNHDSRRVSGVLRGRFGDVTFEQKVKLERASTQTVKLDPSTHSKLHLDHPQLWWPAGYGEPHLYDVELWFEGHGNKTTDRKAFKAGVRQMAYSEEGGDLRIWVNGRRFVAKGGNWGFSESMLRYRAREYDVAARYHREMNFTMIRNWVGQIGDEAFYEACDRNGVMVWQDFWLANPWDGPVPNDDAMFMKNARDLLLRIRNHASIGLYCGRNEWYPPAALQTGLIAAIKELHPDIHYIGSSADGVVSGHGPYMALPPESYFRRPDPKLHSEMGMPNIPPFESLQLMMPEKAMWPQGLDWGLHDFTLKGAQGGTSFLSMIANSYGGANDAEEWMTLAQFVNYQGYQAMFEAQSKYRMGLLLWMSHPCWPSFVWQTYDYYFEPTAAYYGCKNACEPLHIQWNRYTDAVEVVNYSGGDQSGLRAQVEIFNMDGSRRWTNSTMLDSKEDSTTQCFKLEFPAELSDVHFLRMKLTQGTSTVSTNFYLRSSRVNDFRAIRELEKAQIQTSTSVSQTGDRWLLTTKVKNTSSFPALHVRLKAVREKAGDRILPAIYSDNYVTLMPGEERTITTELNDIDTRGEKPKIVIGGFNVA